MLNRITFVEVLAGYRLRIRFADGVEGEVSLKHMVGKGVFAVWSDEAEFAKVTIDPTSGTVTWPGGIDVAPDALYEQLTGSSASSTAPRQF